MSNETTQDSRLLSLEESVRDMAANTERVLVNQQTLSDKVSKGFEDMATAHAKMAATQVSFDARLKPFEEKAAASARRVEIAKKLALPALAASAGVFGAAFGKEVLAMIGRLFG